MGTPTTQRHNWGRESSTARGYGTAWRKLRELILARDAGLCQPCKRRRHISIATQVDHIVGKANGGDDNPANLQAICKPCHDAKTDAEKAGRAWDERPKVTTGLDGWPV